VARNVLLLAAVVGSERLLHTGFLSHACPADALDMEACRIMHRLEKLSPQAAAFNKQGLRARWPDMLQDAVGGVLPIGQAYAYADSDQHREGIAAFLAKRPPEF
jgi:enoyl-CoA hydratase/carnithine racemase